MKLKHMLSIMLLGMISLTAFATTSELEQKPKPTNLFDRTITYQVVNVEAAGFTVIKSSQELISIRNDS